MKIKLLIISIIMTITAWTSVASAYDGKINFMLPSRAGGATGGSAIALTEAMNENGAKTHIAFLGNCKLGKTVYTHNEDPFMMVLPATLQPKCGFQDEPSQDTFVKILTIEGLSIVKHKGRDDLSLEHFLDPNSEKTIGVNGSAMFLVESWMADNNDDSPILMFGNSGATAQASVSNDADYWVLKNTYVSQQLDRLEVLATASSTTQDWIDAPALGQEAPHFKYPDILWANYAIIKGFDEQDRQAVIDIVMDAFDNESFQNYISRPGMVNTSDMSFEEAYKLVRTIQEPYLTLNK